MNAAKAVIKNLLENEEQDPEVEAIYDRLMAMPKAERRAAIDAFFEDPAWTRQKLDRLLRVHGRQRNLAQHDPGI